MLLRIGWTGRVTNEEVLRQINKNVTLTANVKRQKLEYFGHITRHQGKYELLNRIMKEIVLAGEIQEDGEHLD